jgi:hypothetical protein
MLKTHNLIRKDYTVKEYYLLTSDNILYENYLMVLVDSVIQINKLLVLFY